MIELTSTHKQTKGEVMLNPNHICEVFSTGKEDPCGNDQCTGCGCLLVVHNSRQWHVSEDYEYVKSEIYKYEERYLS